MSDNVLGIWYLVGRRDDLALNWAALQVGSWWRDCGNNKVRQHPLAIAVIDDRDDNHLDHADDGDKEDEREFLKNGHIGFVLGVFVCTYSL